MLALLRDRLPVGPGWSYEVKWDGYRAIATKRGDVVTIHSRRGADLTKTYPAAAAALKTLRAQHVVLDGEIVALDPEGRPSFQALQHRSTLGEFTVVYYAFDCLVREQTDLTRQPLMARRRALVEVATDTSVLVSEPLPGSVAEIETTVRAFGLEGVVAKRLDSRYEAGERSGAWVKVKLSLRQEFVIGGFRPNGRMVEALVIGYHEGRGLRAAGKVQAGLNPHSRRELFDLLMPLDTSKCLFMNLPTTRKGHWGEGITAEEMSAFVWVKPRLVAECTFTEWTRDGNLRHAAFVGLRTDKSAREVRREGISR